MYHNIPEPPFMGHTPSHYHPVPPLPPKPEKEEAVFGLKPMSNAEIYNLVSKVYKM